MRSSSSGPFTRTIIYAAVATAPFALAAALASSVSAGEPPLKLYIAIGFAITALALSVFGRSLP